MGRAAPVWPLAGQTLVLTSQLIKSRVDLLGDLPERLEIDLSSQFHPECVLLPLEFCHLSGDLGDALQPIVI
jgi:hypothetical protein